MQKILKKSWLAISALIVIILIGYVYFFRTENNNLTENEEQKIISCTRTTRLDNKPDYDRVLSLIEQRLSEPRVAEFKYFSPKLVNCIGIIEENISDKAVEGYFSFDDKNIRDNYYPITVDNSYTSADYITTALLLSHEITHVQQYIDVLNGKNNLSCVDSEINAFLSELDLYANLNTEENSSAYYRIQNDESLHPQLQMLDTMMTINRDAHFVSKKCEFLDNECTKTNLANELRKMITNDEYYKKECNL